MRLHYTKVGQKFRLFRQNQQFMLEIYQICEPQWHYDEILMFNMISQIKIKQRNTYPVVEEVLNRIKFVLLKSTYLSLKSRKMIVVIFQTHFHNATEYSKQNLFECFLS